ncbi:hypothetical protein [Caballeronia hypogeia]|uniref:hypothetical protein n=1 Tax=Caballeronia hypogeia TaxID=1777140 RepID=UPI0018DF7284|nr:hypothetical protein [Caballeronia hypogeia]
MSRFAGVCSVASAPSTLAKNPSRDPPSPRYVRIACAKLVICATRRGSKSIDNPLVVTNTRCSFDTSLHMTLVQMAFSIMRGIAHMSFVDRHIRFDCWGAGGKRARHIARKARRRMRRHAMKR